MSILNNSFDPKDPAEIIPITFNFAGLTSAPLSPVVSVSHEGGTADANPGNLLFGSPQIIGTQIMQKVHNGVANADYRFRCQVDTPDGNRWVLSGVLPVRTR